MQINFYSGKERLVKVGYEDDFVQENFGRKETFDIADDDQLIGCELDYNSNFFCGVKWIKMKPY